MEMRSGARAAPVWGWRCFLRGYVIFYAKATGIQEENQINRGAAEIRARIASRFRAFWSAPTGVALVYRYDVLGEDAHTLPSGGGIPLRELKSRPCGTPRMTPYIRLGRYRGSEGGEYENT